MFPKLKGKEKKTLVDLMTFIVTATLGPVGNCAVPATLAKEIKKYEPDFITVRSVDEHGTMTPDPAGNVLVFATSKGVAAVQGSGAPGAPVPAAPKPSFQLETGIVLPERKRGGAAREDVYPFGSMEVGQSFFIAATEDNPNPAKGLGSTVSSANKRYAATYPLTVGKAKNPHPKAGQPTGKDGRKFTVRARTTADGEKQNGARVWRIS